MRRTGLPMSPLYKRYIQLRTNCALTALSFFVVALVLVAAKLAAANSFDQYEVYGPVINSKNPDVPVEGTLWIHLSFSIAGVKEPAKISIKTRDDGTQFTRYFLRIPATRVGDTINFEVTHAFLKLEKPEEVTLKWIPDVEWPIRLGHKFDFSNQQPSKIIDHAKNVLHDHNSSNDEIKAALRGLLFVNSKQPSFRSLDLLVLLTKQLVHRNQEIPEAVMNTIVFMDELLEGLPISVPQMFRLYFDSAWAFVPAEDDVSLLTKDVSPGVMRVDMALHFLAKAIQVDESIERSSQEVFLAAKVFQKKYLIESFVGAHEDSFETVRLYLNRYHFDARAKRVQAFLKEAVTSLEILSGYGDGSPEAEYIARVKDNFSHCSKWFFLGRELQKRHDLISNSPPLVKALSLAVRIFGEESFSGSTTTVCRREEVLRKI